MYSCPRQDVLGANKLYNLLPQPDENATSLFSSPLLFSPPHLVRIFFLTFSHHRSRFHSLCRIGCLADTLTHNFGSELFKASQHIQFICTE